MQGYGTQEAKLPEELLELLAGGATYEEAQAELERKRQLQEQLRYQPSELDGRSYGGVYQANNPLEFLGELAERRGGQRQGDQIQREIDQNRRGEKRRVTGALNEMNGMPIAGGMVPTDPNPMSGAAPKGMSMPTDALNSDQTVQELLRRLGRG